ncbi:MAG: DUF3565 domain-containing protein [Chloroflexota bacterium]
MASFRSRITGFYQDEVGDWVATLSCRHQRHIRHNPPWSNYPWILTVEGRNSFLGFELDCKYCQEETSTH